MPIKGLTDEATMGAGLPRIATLYKGSEKEVRKNAQGKEYEAMGKDLDHFRVEFEPQFEHLLPVWRDLYGDEPTEFPHVFLAAGTAAEAFQSWKEEWNAARALIHRCDGEHQVQWYNPDTHIYMKARIPCMSPADANGLVSDPKCACKSVGRLNLILPEFVTATGVLGYIAVTTHSINDILTVYRYLADIERMYGTLTAVPFIFGRAKKEVSAPKTKKDGTREGRIKVTKSLFYLHVEPDFTQQRLLPAMAGALPAPSEARDVETARRRLGRKGSARLGSGGGTHEKATHARWVDDPVQWAKFTKWAATRFNYGVGDILKAFSAAVQRSIASPQDWMMNGATSMAAVIAAACDYDVPAIRRVTADGYETAVYDAAVAIVEVVILGREQEPVE